MISDIREPSVSKGQLWGGRVASGSAAIFLAFDGAMKLVKPAPVLQAFAHLGLPESTSVGIGLVLLACAAVYVVPRTAVLGAVLLTGYLGGAVAIHVRAGDPPFPIVFATFFGVVVWVGIYLREPALRALLPLRR